MSLHLSFLNMGVSANKFDTQCIASHKAICGQLNFGENFKNEKSSPFFTFYATPIWNTGSASWNDKSEKESNYIRSTSSSGVPIKYAYGPLEEHGLWNTSGLFFGFAASDFGSTSAKTLDDNQYSPILYYAPEGMTLISSEGANPGLGKLPSNAELLIGSGNWTADKNSNYYKAFLKSAFEGLTAAELAAADHVASSVTPPNLSSRNNLKDNLIPDDRLWYKSPEASGNTNSYSGNRGLVKISPKIEKKGVRIHVSSCIYEGVMINFHSGASDVKVSSTELSPISGTDQTTALAVAVDKGLLEAALKDLGTTLEDYHFTGLEDSFLSISAGQQLELRDGDHDLIATIFPFVQGGVWIPTSKNYSEAKGDQFLLYVPLGNEGHLGFSGNAGIAIDLKDSCCLAAGAGVTMFNEKNISGFRIPNHPEQVGFYPFKIDVSRKLGHTYYGFASLKAVEFESGASFYTDLVYISHNKDSITLKDPSSDRNAVFKRGKDRYEEMTAWSTLDWNTGLSVCLTQECFFGAGFTMNLRGTAMPKMKTLFANFTLAF